MASTKIIERPDSLSKSAEKHIRDSITKGYFRLGEPLKEAKLSAELGISKTPIREAFAALKLQGLVKILPQRGTFVFTLSEQDVIQLCRYRTILENSALDLALAKDPKALMTTLKQVLADMRVARAADDFQAYLELDAAFHDAFFEHCGNSYLVEGYQKVADIVRTMRTHLSKRPTRTDKSFDEHVRIIQFLDKGHVDAAKEVLEIQITRGERAYSDLAEVKDL